MSKNAGSMIEFYNSLCKYTKGIDKQFEYDSENNYLQNERAWMQIKDDAYRLRIQWLEVAKESIAQDHNLAKDIVELFFINKLKGDDISNNNLYKIALEKVKNP